MQQQLTQLIAITQLMLHQHISPADCIYSVADLLTNSAECKSSGDDLLSNLAECNS
jgi:hypothetical protein